MHVFTVKHQQMVELATDAIGDVFWLSSLPTSTLDLKAPWPDDREEIAMERARRKQLRAVGES